MDVIISNPVGFFAVLFLLIALGYFVISAKKMGSRLFFFVTFVICLAILMAGTRLSTEWVWAFLAVPFGVAGVLFVKDKGRGNKLSGLILLFFTIVFVIAFVTSVGGEGWFVDIWQAIAEALAWIWDRTIGALGRAANA